ncbi:MAG: GIY-YIG nuclease family protein [Candidatus Marinimicrobia bacterium]|nr:GIY-YIG nuclease family protein [Candidatus Neomarinimicrobiota bacterium]
MWYVYILQSKVDGFIYRGMSENPESRLIDHNKGKVKSTKPHRPYYKIYVEKCKNREEARKREKYLKSAAGRRFIKKYLRDTRSSLPDC